MGSCDEREGVGRGGRGGREGEGVGEMGKG